MSGGPEWGIASANSQGSAINSEPMILSGIILVASRFFYVSYEMRGCMSRIPAGVAHGFQTLTDAAEVFYQITERYVPGSSSGVRWNDPAFRIDWPIRPPILSDRDGGYCDYPRGRVDMSDSGRGSASTADDQCAGAARSIRPGDQGAGPGALAARVRRRRHRRLALQRHIRWLRAERDHRHVRALLDRGPQRPQGEVRRARL